MVITHKHTLFIAPNNLEAQTYAERLKANIDNCKVTETTVGIAVEWQELMAYTTVSEDD